MSKSLEALKVWNAVEKYLNLYHHQAIKDDINVETVEGMPIKIIEKSLKALEIIKKKSVAVFYLKQAFMWNDDNKNGCDDYNCHFGFDDDGYRTNDLTQEEYNLLKEVLL